MSGSVTLSSSSVFAQAPRKAAAPTQAAATAPSTRARAERVVVYDSMEAGLRSEAKGETEGEVRRRGGGLERGRRVAGGTEHRLGVDAVVLRPEQAEVARREGERGAAPADRARHERLRQVCRERHFAQAEEVRRAEVARDRAARVFAQHHRGGLPVERRVLVDDRVAVQAVGAADA